MKIYGQLENASLENLSSDPTPAVAGRFYFNSATSRFMLDDGTNKRPLLRSDAFCIFGSSATQANNVRFHRAGNGLFQFVLGSDTTTEGTVSTNVASLTTNLSNSTADVLTYTDQSATPAAPLAGVTKLYSKAGQFYKQASDGIEIQVGSGSGQGTFNYLPLGDFEQGTASVQCATVALTNGLPSGAPSLVSSNSLTLSAETGVQLQGTRSLRASAGSAWAAGDGISLGPVFTVQPAHAGKVLTAKLDYQVVSGNSTLKYGGALGSQSLSLAVYDVTNAAWLPLPPGALGFSTISGSQTVSCTFQTSVTVGQQYRFFVFNLLASTGAVSALFDNVSVSPQTVVNGAAISDWISFTPTGSWNNTTYTGLYRRVGSMLECQVKLAINSNPTVTTGLTVNLPSGLTIDGTKLTDNSYYISYGAGEGGHSSTAYNLQVIPNNTTSVGVLYQSATTGVQTYVNNTTPVTWSADVINIRYSVPIVGWSSNVQLSSDTDTRVLRTTGILSANQSVPATTQTKIQFNTVSVDKNAAFDTVNFRYSVRVSGSYTYSPNIQILSGSSSTTYTLSLYKNGAAIKSVNEISIANGYFSISPNWDDDSVAGDYYEIWLYSSSGAVTVSAASDFNIKRLSGPAVVAATESVNASYTNITGQSIPNNVNTLVTGWVRDFDTHLAFSTGGVFTAPVSGKFEFTAQLCFASSSVVAGQESGIFFGKNGSNTTGRAVVVGYPAAGTVNTTFSGTVLFSLNAGDTVGIYAYQSSGASRSLYNADSTRNWVEIKRVGN